MSVIITRTEYYKRVENDKYGSSSRSVAIPLPATHIQRTESELLLTENMAQAEYQDKCMFDRLVSGIQNQQQLLYRVENHNNNTRRALIDQDFRSKQREQLLVGNNDYEGDVYNHGFSGFLAPSNAIVSVSPETMLENQRSINNIHLTRRASCSHMGYNIGKEETPLNNNNFDSSEIFGDIFDLEL